ncbi:MAG: hypothetical protein BRD48_00370 [Bacteroidetes bacterium QS_9_68_14]|nr:MAG: hypothetical protein BRD48_00370 [Bacteroidetes bacterium QS_9_68_14]
MRCPTARCVAACVLLCLAAAALAGCGRSSMVGRRADDFSAYYNKLYNARKAFDKATDKLDNLERPVDRSAFLSVFVRPARAGSEEDFERATQKSADLLRKHPRSKWVDDALLLIGKSYFYQENHVGAEQKFREVIERGSPLSAEARFWVGRALLASGDWAAAEEHFRRHLGDPDSTESGRWAAQMRLLWGDLRVRRGQWESGARTLAEGLRGVRDGQTRARAFFLRGQALAAAGRWGDAARSYRSAAEERPRYELAYAAEASALRAAARAEGFDVASVLRRLENVESNDKNKAKRSELALLRGRIYQAQGRSGQARRAYRALLYPGDEPTGAAPPSAKVRGRAHYALATLYRDAYDDFSRAAAHFDSAATALPKGGGAGSPAEAGPKATPTAYAVTDSRRQAERYGRVADAAAEVARLDSLLHLGEMSTDDFEAFVDSVRQARTQAAREAQERQARRRAERGFRGRGAAGQDRRGDDGSAAGSGAGGASLASQASGSGADAGFLFHRDPAQVAEGRRVFRRRWGDRPRVPNWRRRAAISTQAEQGARGDPSGPVGPDADVVADGGPRVDVSAVPRSPERLRQMRTERAAARYDLGNALLLATARPDSAAFWFQRVLEENAGTEAARRARYALAEAERAAGRPEAARAQYRRVVKEQPGTRRARRAKRRLAEQQQRQQALDSSAGSARAEQAYARAYQTWQRGRHEAALQQMLDLAASRPQAPAAPQALLAGARIFAEWAAREGRSLTAPLPARARDSLRARLTAAPAGAADSTQQASPPAPSGEEAPPLTLARLLKGLERRYPETPYADRAQAMQAALRETAPAAPEETPAAATPREAPDTSAAAAARDTTASREGGAWGIVVAHEAERARADSTAARLRARRRRALVRVLPAAPRGAAGYRVVLGAFPTRAEAQAALRRRRATLPDSSRLEAVPPESTAASE